MNWPKHMTEKSFGLPLPTLQKWAPMTFGFGSERDCGLISPNSYNKYFNFDKL